MTPSLGDFHGFPIAAIRLMKPKSMKKSGFPIISYMFSMASCIPSDWIWIINSEAAPASCAGSGIQLGSSAESQIDWHKRKPIEMASTESGSIRQKVEMNERRRRVFNHEILGNKNSIHLWIAGTLKISKSVVAGNLTISGSDWRWWNH